MGTFAISTKDNGDYKYTYNNKRGKTVLTSLGYKSKEECKAAIIELMQNIDKISVAKFKSTSGKFFIRLLWNDNVLCTSRKFTTILRLEKAITDILENVSKSELLDFTDFNFPEINFDE